MLSQPLDQNSSPYLLMIAPPNDSRYRYLKRNPSSNPLLLQPPSANQLQFELHKQQTNICSSQTAKDVIYCRPCPHLPKVDSMTHLSGPTYMQQLSALAAMAWSDCAQVGEKLRRIYCQAASLATPASKPLANQQFLTPDCYSITSQSGIVQFPVNVVSGGSRSHCACARCQATMPDQSCTTLQSYFASSILKSHVTSSLFERDLCQTAVQVKPRMKRKACFDDVTIQHLSSKKIMTAQHCPVDTAMITSTCHHGDEFAPDLLVHPQLEPLTSATELVMTPAFENHCYFGAYTVNENVHASHPRLNSFDVVFPTHMAGAIK